MAAVVRYVALTSAVWQLFDELERCAMGRLHQSRIQTREERVQEKC